MITIGWGAVFVFLFCMFSLALGPHPVFAQWALIALAVLAFMIGFFAFGAHNSEKIPEDHPGALGSLDLLQRHGSGGDGRLSDPKRTPSPPIHRPVSPYLARKEAR